MLSTIANVRIVVALLISIIIIVALAKPIQSRRVAAM